MAVTDQIIGTAEDNGQFSMQSAVESMNNQQPFTIWSEVLCFKGMIPKHSICLWMALQNELKTRMLLSSKLLILINDTSCTLCHSNIEFCPTCLESALIQLKTNSFFYRPYAIRPREVILFWQNCVTHLLFGTSGGKETQGFLKTKNCHGRSLFRQSCIKLEQEQHIFLLSSPLIMKWFGTCLLLLHYPRVL